MTEANGAQISCGSIAVLCCRYPGAPLGSSARNARNALLSVHDIVTSCVDGEAAHAATK